LSLVIAIAAAGAMGLITAGLHLMLRIPVILAGLVMSIGFYSVTLRVLGLPSLSLAGASSLLAWADRATNQNESDLLTIGVFALAVLAVLVLVGMGLRTQIGLALRASGVNAAMARSCGVNDKAMLVLSLCLANGLAGMSGALVVQGQRFVDVNMGAGTLISGIGAVLLGDLLVRPAGSKVLRVLFAVLIGALLYRFVLVESLRLGVPATDLQGITAVILVAALGAERYLRPMLVSLFRRRHRSAGAAAAAADDATASEVQRAHA
jgi:putative ABC transport system permease protein